MRLSFFSIFMLISFALYGQQTIELSQDVMGTFSSDNIECYELTIEETGEYILSYNLLDATVTVLTADEQELFSDYMDFFAPSPKEQQLTLNASTSYQICFSRGGESAMYQCRIDKKQTGPVNAIPLEYGEYITRELSVDGNGVRYSFNGNENDKIRTGITTIFGVSVTLTSPTDNVVYDQSYEIPPSDGIKLEFDLEETGEYLIAITPLSSYLQFTLSLHLLEPVLASDIQFNKSYVGTLGNFGVDYYQFYGYPEDTVQLNCYGYTAGMTIQVETPGNATIVCNDTIDEIHIVHRLIIEEEGTYYITLESDLQGINSYSLMVKSNREPVEPNNFPYEPGTLIIKEVIRSVKQNYTFTGSQNDILRIGLDLPSKVIELKDPDGTIIYSLYDSTSNNLPTEFFKEIELDSNGEYTISICHGCSDYSPVIMKFCASFVPQPYIMEKDSLYNITVPPFHRLPYGFEADSGQAVRLIFPAGCELLTPGTDTISFKKGESFILTETGTYIINLYNNFTNPATLQICVETTFNLLEIPFGTTTDYEASGIYTCRVPSGLDEIFIIVKKFNCIGYDNTWRGDVTLEHGNQTWQSMVGNKVERHDFMFYLEQPDTGLYTLPVFAETLSEEPRGSVLFTNNLPEAIMNGWSSGVIQRPYGSDWKIIDIDQQMDTLRFETEGFGMWSTLYVSYDKIVNPSASWGFYSSDHGYNIKGEIINAPAGRYYIRYEDSAVLQDSDEGFFNHLEDQSRTYMLYVGSALSDNAGLLSLRDVSSHLLGTGKASITLFGSGLSLVSAVNLVSENEQVTIPMNIQDIADNGRELVAGYNFVGVDPGTYFLEIVSPDTLIRHSRTIEITPLVTTSISSSMLTSEQYRIGRHQKCIIRIRNSGTTDIPYAAGYFYTPNDQVSIFVTDTPDSQFDADSINNIILKDQVFNEMPFFIENLKVNEEAEFIFKIFSSTVANNDPFKVGYKLAVVSESDYFSLLDPLVTSWYNFMDTSLIIPASVKYYLDELTLERFIAVWHGDDSGDLKKSGTLKGSNTEKAAHLENCITTSIKLLSFAVDKGLPFSTPFGDASELLKILTNPYNTATAGVKVIWNAAKDVSKALDSVIDFLTGDGSENGSDNEYVAEEEVMKYPINSTTPEDKYGPVGYGTGSGKDYIDSLKLFEYRIDYWNKEDATAPAAIVYIRDTIDTDFDLKTLRFTEIGFLKWKLKLDGGQYFNVNVDCRPDMPYIVNVEGTLDYASREVYWVHTTLDPETMELPDDPMAGYLPPIDSTAYQMGWVNLSIRPIEDLPHGTSFENQAFVNFEGVGVWGPAPPYGPYTNIFDFVPAWSLIETLDPVKTELSFDLKLQGDDQGCGIDHFDIYVSKDGEPTYLWKTTEDTTLTFTGEDGASYDFYSVAIDMVGNAEPMNSLFDTNTLIELDETGISENITDQSPKFYVCPNPATNHLNLKVENYETDNLSYQLYNIKGTLLENRKIEDVETDIIVRNFNAGTYFLKVIDKQREIKTFKIIKN